MQRTSATCYFAYNDAAVHANARNHPGDDIKRGPLLPSTPSLPFPPFSSPGGDIRVERTLLRPLRKGKKKNRKKRKKNMDRSLFPPREIAAGKNRARLPCDGIDHLRLRENNERPSLTRRRLSKCENRHRNWARYYR